MGKSLGKDVAGLFFVHIFLAMSNQEIELTETRKLDVVMSDVVVETEEPDTRPASISTLFFRYSTKKERAVLFLGFACT